MNTTPVTASVGLLILTAVFGATAFRIHEYVGGSRARSLTEVAALPEAIKEKERLQARLTAIQAGTSEQNAQRELELKRAGITPRVQEICSRLHIKTESVGVYEEDNTLRMSVAANSASLLQLINEIEQSEPMLRLRESRFNAAADGVFAAIIWDVWLPPVYSR